MFGLCDHSPRLHFVVNWCSRTCRYFDRLEKELDRIGIVGTGFVADLYMRPLATLPHLKVVMAYDIGRPPARDLLSALEPYSAHSLSELLQGGTDSPVLIVNLTILRHISLRAEPVCRPARMFKPMPWAKT
jgi:hypothetical protein